MTEGLKTVGDEKLWIGQLFFFLTNLRCGRHIIIWVLCLSRWFARRGTVSVPLPNFPHKGFLLSIVKSKKGISMFHITHVRSKSDWYPQTKCFLMDGDTLVDLPVRHGRALTFEVREISSMADFADYLRRQTDTEIDDLWHP